MRGAVVEERFGGGDLARARSLVWRAVAGGRETCRGGGGYRSGGACRFYRERLVWGGQEEGSLLATAGLDSLLYDFDFFLFQLSFL